MRESEYGDISAEQAEQLALRIPGLLDAVIEVGQDLELPAVLRRIVEVAVDLVDCRYGALGVIGEDYANAGHGDPGPSLAEFVTTGIDDAERELIGPLPHGEGILGVLVRQPQLLRLDDLRAHRDSVGFPVNHPPMTSFLGVPIAIGDEIFGNLYLTEKRAGHFTAQDEAVVRALATAAGAAIDRARIHAAVRRSEQWQRAMAAINQLLLAGAETSDVLTLVAQSARALANADLAAIGFDDDGGGNLVAEIVDGADADHIMQLIGSPLPWAEPCLLIPLGWQSQTAALCIANHTRNRRFDPEIVTALKSFAGQAVLALELAEARRDAERLAVYQDRDRIARDLHDTVIQRLFATGMRLESISRRVDGQPRDDIQQTVDDLDGTIREIRSTIYSLENIERGDAIGLRARIAGLAEQLKSIAGIAASIEIDGPVDALVTEEVANDAVTVLRELLSNIARHAQARRVSVTVSAADSGVTMTVRDDGCGFDPDDPQLRRSGLRNAAARAQSHGGACEVESARRSGQSGKSGASDGESQGESDGEWTTSVHWSVPLRTQQ